MKLRPYYWTVSIWILTLLAVMTQVWSASHTGYSGMVTIDRRVKPVVTSLEPSAGSTKGGTTVNVKGDKFYAGLTTVKLSGKAINPVSIKSEMELSFKTPADSAGLVDLEVFNPDGISSKLSQAFKYEVPIVKMVEVKATADTLVANGVASTQITIRLLDQNGELVTDETVNLLADRGAIAAQAINNKDGTYTATYKSSQTFGLANITAATTTGDKLGKVELTLTQRQVSAEKSTVSLDRNWAMIGQEGAVLTVKVVDKQGLVMEGQTVTAEVEPAEKATVGIAKTTDKQGETQLRIQSVTAGDRKITVQVGEVVLTSTASVKFTSNQVENVLINAGGVRKVGELITVSLTLQNAAKLPVSGQRVQVVVEPEAGVTLTQPTQDSDVHGKLEAKLFSQTAGLKMLKVRSGDTTLENSAAITFQAGAVEKVKITAGKTWMMPGTNTILTVTVTDQYDNALKGESVKLTSTLGQVGTITDNEDGTYGAAFTAPDKTGQAIVTATVATKNADLGFTVAELAGDVNGDNSVNIFDLVMVASMFGRAGQGLSGDVTVDGLVNIFDLVQVTGYFGKRVLAAAPSLLVEKLTFTNQQKRHIQSAIVELEEMPARSAAEELAFSFLKAMLPERLPEQTQLLPNYPNPFNPETWIPFELNQDSDVSLTIYEAAGRLVRHLDLGVQPAGAYLQRDRAIYWDGRTQSGEQVASGTYFYTLKTADYVSTQKMIILK